MAQRRMGIIALLTCLCLWLAPFRVLAASTADATEQISLLRTCTLTVTYGHDGEAFADVPVKLYQIASASANARYTLTSTFRPSGLTINGIRSVREWNVIRASLESFILAQSIPETHAAVTDQNGTVTFDALKPGLYLAVAAQVEQETQIHTFDSALIALPGLNENGRWQYQVDVVAKSSVTALPTPDDPTPETELQLQILKLWNGDSDRADRPQSVTVAIFRNGQLAETVTLSAENNWSYTWTAPDDGAEWMVAEQNVDANYTATLEKRGTAFLLTNTRTQDDPEPDDPSPDDPDMPTPDDPDVPPTPDAPPDNPQTGDTANVMLYIVLMFISGIMMVLLGVTGKRKRT
ncbi:MAG: Cna B-type domain-containing protein [Clostridia bacterium]|nr:Cna B-type domain-containing protein [Clostridia bacterium]